VNSYFVLRALAAREMPQVRHSWCCCAAVNPVIHAVCSKPEAANLHNASFVAVRLLNFKVRIPDIDPRR
jgi:hypothetical protein|tara:strand:- start:527 stop:733 length:207 start_codon:yes stop_codon:yes gene_type:complete